MTLCRLVKWSGQDLSETFESYSKRFSFCVSCGNVSDPRFNPDRNSEKVQLLIYAKRSEVSEYGKRYEFSKKKLQRGENVLTPLLPKYPTIRNNLTLVNIMLMDLLWLWENRSSEEFMICANETCIVRCLNCYSVPISLVETSNVDSDEMI